MACEREAIFTMEAIPVKHGAGAWGDAGWELSRLGVRRAMLVTDPRVAALGPPERIKELIEAKGMEVIVYDRARVEPTLDCSTRTLRSPPSRELARRRPPWRCSTSRRSR